jgi:outer membrane protein assembly factor BamB
MKARCMILGWLVCWCGYADDWPQWRGANRDGHSSETLQVHGLGAGPRILWRAAVGTGFSAISVSQNRVYTMGNANDSDTIWCLDAVKGSVLWKKTYPAKLGAVYYEGGPGSTPTVHEKKVYTISKWGKVFCLDALTGTEVWNHDLAQEGIKSNRWGFAGSPLIWKDLVIFNAGSAGTALDRNTGRMVWFNGTEPTGYASPTRFITEGTECVLIFAAKHLVAIEPATGKELWRYPWETGYDTNNPDPLIYRNTIFISSYSAGCALLEVHQGKPKLVYRSKVLHNHLSPGILVGEYLYAFNGEAKQSTDFRCIHLPTGEMKWSRKDPAMGSLIAANGNLIILSERGELLVSEASPAGLKTLSRSQLLGGLCWTPPALAEKRLYARNAKGELVCADLTSHESSQ